MVEKLERLIDLVFPPRCANCEELLDFIGTKSTDALCKECLEKWEIEKADTCGYCMKEVRECTCMTEALEKSGCKAFYKLTYYRHGTRSFVQNKLIFRIKNTRDRHAASFLAAELSRVVADSGVDALLDPTQTVITYVPRRRATYLESGTDQAKALAVAMSKELKLPTVRALIRKSGDQKEQKTLSTRERMRNARASYDVRSDVDLKGKTVLLIDDIVTTGASMAVCVKKLKRAGACAVYCAAVASDDANQAPLGALPTKSDIFSAAH